MAVALSARELTKPGREERLMIFAKKYKDNGEFELMNGKKVKLIYDKKTYDKIVRKQGLDEITFWTTIGTQIKLKNLKKTNEFGGKEISTTHIEEKEIISIRKQMSEIRKKTGEPTVPIKVKNQIYEVFEVVKTGGTPKSDFHFLDQEGKPILWVSHKDGNRASDFQQWGGISKIVPNTHTHNETKEFIKDLEENFKEGLPRATNVVKDIKDTTLKNKAVYGDEFKPNSRNFSEHNIQLVLQGTVKLVKRGNYYILTANQVHSNGEKMTGDYEPTFSAQYRSDRGAPVKNARASIWPKVVEKRKNTIKINK